MNLTTRPLTPGKYVDALEYLAGRAKAGKLYFVEGIALEAEVMLMRDDDAGAFGLYLRVGGFWHKIDAVHAGDADILRMVKDDAMTRHESERYQQAKASAVERERRKREAEEKRKSDEAAAIEAARSRWTDARREEEAETERARRIAAQWMGQRAKLPISGIGKMPT